MVSWLPCPIPSWLLVLLFSSFILVLKLVSVVSKLVTVLPKRDTVPKGFTYEKMGNEFTEGERERKFRTAT